ncbi:MAG: ribonuclease J [Rhodospirillales bacterium]|nr:ribonuclease J [Alphaproteobacteria bacterium]MCB9987356.1 ribonuclease J [Rhodospirillales bacterium]USO07795.1 MAG: ribonuclease J [Rhodospirillales bacterium]
MKAKIKHDERLPVPGRDGVTFLPLGGCGQFGANFTLYGYDGNWIAVDCGMSFADERLPGVDVVLPDPTLIAEQRDRLKALFVTHAHEDHIGAIAWLWPRLRCPVYATPFTAALLRRKLEEHVFPDGGPKIHVIKPGESVTPENGWSVTFVPVAHSIPEGNALAIVTPAGRIVHTGDWCLDPDPILGTHTSPETFRALGAAGVMAYVGDSTNADVRTQPPTELEVEAGLAEVFKGAPRRIAVTLFASNVARIISIYRAAQKVGRQVALVGRSLDTMVECAREVGIMPAHMRFLTGDDAADMADDKVVLVVTGSQGEARAALSRIARGVHPSVKLKPDDVMVFSSRAIPGNEVAINEIKNELLAMGVKIVTDRDARVHVSGHPVRADLAQMIDWLKPAAAIAVHGERVQMESHAALAREKQVRSVRVGANGEMLLIKPDGVYPQKVFPVVFNAVDFDRIVPADDIAILERRKMSFNGAVFVSIVADGKSGDVLDVQASTVGLFDPARDEDAQHLADLEDAAADRFERLPRKERLSQDAGEEAVRASVKRFFRDLHDIKPLVNVHVSLV